MQPSTRSRFSLAVGVLLVLLLPLVLAGPGVAGLEAIGTDDAAVATQPEPAGDLALPERVVLQDSAQSGTALVGPDAGTALDRGGSELDGAYRRYLLEERLSSADSETQQRSIIEAEVQYLNDSVSALAERERSARLSYVAGELSERAYLGRLAEIDGEAAELERLADSIAPVEQGESGLADEYGASALTADIEALRGGILIRQGPVRSDVGAIGTGDRDVARYYVVASPNGSVVSTVSDGTYHRETARDDLLVPGDERGISLNEAYELARTELYPRYISNTDFSGFSTISSGQVYRVLGEDQLDYQHGFRSYVDAVSEDVFWEYQRIQLDENVPTASPVTNASDDVQVAVHPTYDTGPARVVVTSDGAPVSDAAVSVDGNVVTETDADGRAWIVLPPESPVVTASTSDGTVSVAIEWEFDGTATGGLAAG
jgi:archaellum component FlaF (FlaF/FlaG flagellin family)